MRKDKGRKKEMEVKRMILLASAFAAIVMIAVYVLGLRNVGSAAVAFRVNGEPVTVDEFKLIMEHKKSEVMIYFNEKYKAPYTGSFWTTPYNSEVPLEVLKQKTMDELIRIKIQQRMFLQKGIVQEISFSAFEKSLKEENRRRTEANKKDEPIAGPVQYKAYDFYDFSFKSLCAYYKKEVASPELKPTEVELRDFYDRNKGTYYKTDAGYLTYDEVKESLKSLVSEEKYNRMIDSLVRDAKIEINRKVYETGITE